ncbi:MAG TPA: cupin domain-containing protein [Labilithrix sp.]
MTDDAILRWNEAADGPLSEGAMRAKLEALGYSVTRWTYSPGTIFDTHTHDVDKIDGVLRGRFQLTLRGFVHVLGPGDAVRVPRGAPHRAEVLGDEAVVSLDAVRR